VTTINFSHDSLYLYAAGRGGDVYVWDMRKQVCTRRYQDHGTVHTTVLSNCSRGIYQATGTDSGVVNIYRTDDAFLSTSTPTPFKSIMNITTSVSNIVFNHDSQLLVASSVANKGTVKMVHLPSGTVNKFWPITQFPASAMAFSPDSSKFAVGTLSGKVLLYRLHHYATNNN